MAGFCVIHSDDLPWESGGRGDLFAHRRRRLGREAGGRGLGCSMVELDPGKTAWPFHYHQANEEALYMLSGEATLRLGAQRLRVRGGDYVALPAGADHAHQLTNTGGEIVRYLVISTMVSPDVCVYPDANKVGVVDALDDAQGTRLRVVTFPRDAAVDYWEGEATTLGGSAAAAEAEAAAEADADADADASREGPDTAEDDADARQAKIEQMVESDLQALKHKLGLDSMADRDLDDLKAELQDE